MPRVQIIITIDTDPVPGMWHEPEHYVDLFQHEVDRFPESYRGKVELAKPIRNVNCLTGADLMRELGYEDAQRFIEWADRRYFLVDDNPTTKWFWKTDFNEWLSRGVKAPEGTH